ncbi:carbohydrate ABC transporter permease [Microcella sp.]|uniref:carbohydrate ABC transporter permease n=1 Tax=Microcella sp. TaxID=1913979 RepID=UPI003F6EB899
MGRAFTIVFLGFFVVFFIIPIIWLLLAPAKTAQQLYFENPLSVGTLETFVANWNQLIGFQDGLFFQWMGNSVLYSGAALVITLVVSIPAGYALAVSSFRLRRPLLITTLIVMLIPGTALVLPIFLELSAFKLIGSPLAVILPSAFFPFGVYLTYIYFSTNMSKDLLDAARIDGAGELLVFARIALPLATPVVALVGFFSVVGTWNNYFLPFLVVPGRMSTVQVGLAQMLSNVKQLNPTSAGSIAIELPVMFVAILLSILPVLLIFLFSQRFLITGLTAGGSKE